MIISDSQAADLLDLMLGADTYTPPGTWYFGLVTSAPAQNGSGYGEVIGGSYARVAKTNNITNFPAVFGATREKQNGTDVTFPQASAAWGVVVGVCLFEASTGGNAKVYVPFATPETVAINNTVSFTTGQFKLRVKV